MNARMLVPVLMTLALLPAVPTAPAAATVFGDEGAFAAATSATLRTPFAQQAWAVASYAEGGITLTHASTEWSYVYEWTTVLPGLEYGVNGPEAFNVLLDVPASAFGLHLDDGFSSKLWDTTAGQDSAWKVRFLSEGALVHETFVDPAPDTDTFFGIALDVAFDRVEFREYQGGIACPLGGTGCYEDDYFSGFMVADAPTNGAPDCAAAAPTLTSLWPPNHKMVAVTVGGVTDVDGDAIVVRVTSVRQDEAVEALGDGAASPDAAGLGDATVDLRAERSGLGNGRVYALGFEGSDPSGASCSGVVRVEVRHSAGVAATDDGATFDSTAP